MVHALEEVQRLLKSDGCLIDIQPLIEAPLLKIYQGSSVIFVEPDPSYDYEEDLRQANAALTQVIQRGLFVIEERSEFDFLTHGSSAQELLAFWGKASADDNISEDPAEQRIKEVYARVEEIRQAAGEGAEVALHERARILRLNPNSRNEEPV
ncbi:MAG TPA: hypothetical protein VGA72_14170 [Anaerolineales bacterium]